MSDRLEAPSCIAELDGPELQRRYAGAFARWEQAAALLWTADTPQ
jgi:hypothetical protein